MSGRKKREAIHPAIKERLGYDVDLTDSEFLADWKRRSTHVCKPCWELKYCPYGPFVEQSPLLPPLRGPSVAHHEYIVGCLQTGLIGHSGPMPEETRNAFESLSSLYDEDPTAFAVHIVRQLSQEKAFEEAASNGTDLSDVLGLGPLPPIHRYRAPFPFEAEEHNDKDFKIPPEVKKAARAEIKKIRQALASGIYDNRRPLDSARRAWFQEEASSFSPDDYPEHIPEIISDMACNIFGHICPVVFVGENISETSDERRRGRYIPFTVKMRVVRRDNYTCQECGKHLRDDEVEFDHIIPVSKGGSSEEHNIRLTCFDCNRDKSDAIKL